LQVSQNRRGGLRSRRRKMSLNCESGRRSDRDRLGPVASGPCSRSTGFAIDDSAGGSSPSGPWASEIVILRARRARTLGNTKSPWRSMVSLRQHTPSAWRTWTGAPSGTSCPLLSTTFHHSWSRCPANVALRAIRMGSAGLGASTAEKTLRAQAAGCAAGRIVS